jgi:hypothetical protein
MSVAPVCAVTAPYLGVFAPECFAECNEYFSYPARKEIVLHVRWGNPLNRSVADRAGLSSKSASSLHAGEKMALVIGLLGAVSTLGDNRAGDATWNEGCIHIRQRAQLAIVSIDFDRLTGPAIAAALYELGDMEPGKICLTAGKNGTTEVLIGFKPPF